MPLLFQGVLTIPFLVVGIRSGPWWLEGGGRLLLVLKPWVILGYLAVLQTDFLILRFPERNTVITQESPLPKIQFANLAHGVKFDHNINLLLSFPCNFPPPLPCSHVCLFLKGKHGNQNPLVLYHLGQLHCFYLESYYLTDWVTAFVQFLYCKSLYSRWLSV